MAGQYANDWEDSRLAVDGFVTDYIVWRLAKGGLEWRSAPDVPENADQEHEVMRTMCDIFEERNGNDLLDLGMGLEIVDYDSYRKVVDLFGTDTPSDMTYGRLVGMITFAGLLCVEKARENKMDDIEQIARFTSDYIGSSIRSTWSQSRRSWAHFTAISERVVAGNAAERAASRRRSSLLLVAAASIVGVCVVGRMLVKSH